MQGHLGDAGLETGHEVEECLAGAHRRQRGEAVGKEHALVGGQAPHRESHVGLGVGAEQAKGKAEIHCQLEVDIEELGPQEQGIEMGIEMADVEAPEDGPLDLGPALPADLVDVGVIPDVGDGPGEAAVPVEQRGAWVIGAQR